MYNFPVSIITYIEVVWCKETEVQVFLYLIRVGMR